MTDAPRTEDGTEREAALRQTLRNHAALPGLPNWCSCGHRGETNYQRETHLVETLGGVL